MIRKPTWILLAILAVVAALAWYLEFTPARAQAHQTPDPTEAARLLPDIESTGITRIEVIRKTGENLVVERDAQGKYGFVGQAGKAVDQGMLLELAAELAALRITSTVQSGTQVETIGLVDPVTTLSIEGSNRARHILKIGSLTPVGTGYYVQVDARPPVVVDNGGMDRILSFTSIEALTAATETPQPSLEVTPAP